jgi:hypothetical protein
MFAQMTAEADAAILERRDLEAAEAGRRQREGFEYPKGGGEDISRNHADAHRH